MPCNDNNSVFKTILKAIARAVSYVYSPALCRSLGRLKNVVYSGWISREFAHAEGVSFSTGLSLIGADKISIGRGTGLGHNGVLQAWTSRDGCRFTPSITIGRDCWIGDNFNISAVNSITIGDNVLTGRFVTILDNSHGNLSERSMSVPPLQRPPVSKGPVTIGNNVWIGDKATILAGVTVGNGAVIAANSVVTHDVAPMTCVAGCPAKPIIKTE